MKSKTIARQTAGCAVGVLACLWLVPERVECQIADTKAAATARPFTPKLPLFFEKNEGQVDRRAGFLARMPAATLYLTGEDAIVVHAGAKKASALRMHWIGASRAAAPTGEAEMTAKSNYFIGNDQSQWHSGVPNFQRVRQNDLYPGVDLVYYGNQEQLEYDLTAQPGADTTNIRLRIEGANKVDLDPATGDLVLVDAVGSPLRLLKPVVYQADRNQDRTSISAAYALSAHNTVSFLLGDYDHTRPLVIDPQVMYSTVFGGTMPATTGYGAGNLYTGMTVDQYGFVYLSGTTTTINLPTTTGAFQPACNEYVSGSTAQCSNFFVAKFDPTQSGVASLVYATYIGGNTTGVGVFEYSDPDSVSDLAVDGNGDAYFAGYTYTETYPTTSNAYAPACNLTGAPPGATCPDTFLTELNPNGSGLLYSTWLQPYFPYGEGLAAPGMIAVDGSQNAYISGQDGDTTWYLAAYATTQSGNASFLYATGLSFPPAAIAADPSGNVYLGGYEWAASGNGTNGNQFINLNGFETSVPLGDEPGILVKFNTSGQNTYATLVGVASGSVFGVSADPDGTAYITGRAANLTQVNGLPSAASATSGDFVAVIDTTQTGSASLLYSTYINPADPESMGYNISGNGTGLFAFTGRAIEYESSYPLVNPLVQPFAIPEEITQGYPFVGVIDTTKTGQNALIFLSFLDGAEQAYGVFLDSGGSSQLRSNAEGETTTNVYVAGSASTITPSSPFLGVPASYSTSLNPSNGSTPVFFYQIGLGPVDSISTSPFLLAFPNQEVGTTSPPLSFTVTNTTNFTVPIDAVSASSQFNETDNCANSALGAGASCTVQVTFEPTAITASSTFPTTGTVSISVAGSSVPLAENVTGIGVSSSTPTAFFTPQSFSFGSQPSGSTSSPATFTLTNTGSVALAGEGGPIIDLSTYPGAFVLQSNTCGITLAVGASCQATVAFAPTTTSASNNGNSNSYSQALYAYFNNSYEATTTLTGTGVAPAPSGTLSATSLTFPSTALGTSVQQNITLTNTGNATLTGIAIGNPPVGTGASSYTLSGGCLTTDTLAVQASCTLTVTFDPQAIGSLTAQLSVTNNGIPAAQTVYLYGTGVLPGQSQTITFLPLGNQTLGGPPFTVSATATSGLSVSFNSITPSICSTSGASVTLLAVGVCTIQATQGGNGTYSPAPAVNQSFLVLPEAPCGTAAPTSIYVDNTGDSPQTLTITAPPSCSWYALTASSWMQLSPASGTGNGTVQVTIAPNSTGADLTGSITAGETTVSVDEAFTKQVFADVPPSAYYFDAVNLMSTLGITAGCSVTPYDYCPTEQINRAQMAIFIVRAVYGGNTSFPYSPTPWFSDVPADYYAFPWIQAMYELGITTGCGDGMFCPTDTVTRGQMAVFIIRARYGAGTLFTSPSTPYFSDVPASNVFFTYIQRMKEDNITAGCSATTYCPNNPVIRGDMAIFIMRGAFNQLLPPGEPVIASIVPNTLTAGSSGSYTVTGVNTNFVQGTTTVVTVDNGAVTASNVTVTSPTTLTVTLTATSGASQQPVSIYVQTEPQEAVLPNGLTVQ
jgi:hypothetical protein